jgi:hypothetical protein
MGLNSPAEPKKGFTKLNKNGVIIYDFSPWAIIRAKHPVAPVFVPAITPAITSLMWATEE